MTIHHTSAAVVEEKLQKLLATLSKPLTREQREAVRLWYPRKKKTR